MARTARYQLLRVDAASIVDQKSVVLSIVNGLAKALRGPSCRGMGASESTYLPNRWRALVGFARAVLLLVTSALTKNQAERETLRLD